MIIILLTLCLTISKTYAEYCDCGHEGIRSRIYNGRVTDRGRYPWSAHIRFTQPWSSSYAQCGGSLIDNQHVVTAAHCLFNEDRELQKPVYTQVYLGIQDKNKDYKKAVVVDEFIYDARYSPNSPMNYDIAILRLKNPIKYSDTIYPICVPSSDSQVYQRLKTIGWGNIDGKNTQSDVLREVDVDLISKQTCNQMKRVFTLKKHGLPVDANVEIPSVHENHICALNMATGGDACSGDSGGPLMFKNPRDSRWYLIGVVSGAWDLCGVDRGVPGLYTSIAPYRAAIQQTATDACIRPY